MISHYVKKKNRLNKVDRQQQNSVNHQEYLSYLLDLLYHRFSRSNLM